MTKDTHQRQAENIRRYYQFQSRIYDATRWTFLFGRKEIIDRLPLSRKAEIDIMEIGCGTGRNLSHLARLFPNARITGIDVSGHMLRIAGRRLRKFEPRIQLLEKPYALGDDEFSNGIDLILFSYSLTMINPQWEELLRQAAADLRPGGLIAVVDFHDSRFSWFKNHMADHHVRMDGHLLPVLSRLFTSELKEVKSAYGTAWQYFLFMGRKPGK
jgi:S-adenosylmethionine-diacylgycerolhomoserine-N-methlytransferase